MLSDEMLSEILRYCRLEDFGDDETVLATVNELYDTAVEYLTEAGITQGKSNDRRYALAVKSLVCHWYDNRTVTGGGADLPFGLKQIINQLKLAAAVQAASEV